MNSRMGRASLLSLCPTVVQPSAAGKFDFSGITGFFDKTDTMLEQMSLHLRSWNKPPNSAPGGQVRTVADAEGVTVGFVRQRPGRGPRWLGWLGRRTLKAYEAPDGSLVFALRRGWGRLGGWQVLDADEQLVGTLRGRAMFDVVGDFLAAIEQMDA